MNLILGGITGTACDTTDETRHVKQHEDPAKLPDIRTRLWKVTRVVARCSQTRAHKHFLALHTCLEVKSEVNTD